MKKKLLSSITLLCMVMNLLVPLAASAEDIDEMPMPTPPVATDVPSVTVTPDTGEDDFDEIPMLTPTPTPVPTATPEITTTPDVTESPKPGEIIITTDEPIIIIPSEPTDEPLCSSPGPDMTPEPTPPGGLCSSPGPDVTPKPTDEPLCSSPGPEVTESPSIQPGETGSTSNPGAGSQGDEIFPPYYLTIWDSDENGFEIFARAEDISDVVVYAASYDGDGRLVGLQSYKMQEANQMIRYDMPILKEGHAKVYMWRGITSLTEIKFIKILSM